ncbi:hypothetical protein EU527_05415 [Candidatus Thorarchaeota archaeon]|nr:MAG: hypothetical protein EU527_05415 [Candidatus Thorarchaeota archaeon]
MAQQWLAITKAEFQVLSASMRSHRKMYVGVLIAIAFFWAVVIAPIVIGSFINALIPMDTLRPLLQLIFPGLMRTIILFLWILLLLFPLSYALQEIKIGQWEIFLSNNVSTRNIIAGTFLGKIPLFGLIVVFLSPLLITPLVLAFEVNILGQILLYGVITLLALGTIWLSNFVTGVIQARLGDSSRGNDIAKGLSMVIAIIVIIPMYSLMFFLPAMSEMMGMDAFLILPSTWFADTLSWLAITFNGVGLTGHQIATFGSILHLDLLVSSLLMGGFVFATIIIALGAADRVFTIDAGVRTQIVTTVRGESFILRGIRRLSPGPFGTLMVSNFKDFLRKAQNLSKIFYGVVLACIFPIILTTVNVEYVQMREMVFMIIAMLSLIGSFPFAGVGFLESQDQLWIIQGAPNGASKFVKSRIVTQAMIGIPLIFIPTTLLYFVLEMTFFELLALIGLGYMAIFGGMLISTGITAGNPNYEDTKSPAHQANLMTSVMLAEFSIVGVLFADMFLTIGLDIDFLGLVANIVGPPNVMFGMSLIGLLVQWSLGALLVWIGIRKLSGPAN